MFKRIVVLLFFVQVSLGQNNVLNDITITPLKGYEYKSDISNNIQATFINPQGFELKFVVAKIKDSNITKPRIKEVISEGNSFINWQIEQGFSFSNIPIQLASVKSNSFGIQGYRTGFKLKEKLVIVTHFAIGNNKNIKTIALNTTKSVTENLIKKNLPQNFSSNSSIRTTYFGDTIPSSKNKPVLKSKVWMNGKAFWAPEGFEHQGNFVWRKENDLITIQSSKGFMNGEEFLKNCEKGTESASYLMSDSLDYNGKVYNLCYSIGANDMLISQTFVNYNGYIYVLTNGTYIYDYVDGELNDSNILDAMRPAITKLKYYGSYMISTINNPEL